MVIFSINTPHHWLSSLEIPPPFWESCQHQNFKTTLFRYGRFSKYLVHSMHTNTNTFWFQKFILATQICLFFLIHQIYVLKIYVRHSIYIHWKAFPFPKLSQNYEIFAGNFNWKQPIHYLWALHSWLMFVFLLAEKFYSSGKAFSWSEIMKKSGAWDII